MNGKQLGGVVAIAASLGLSVGCAADDVATEATGADEAAFASALARLYDFEFDGEVVAAAGANPKSTIKAQLLFTVGHFNAEPGLAQLPKLVLSNIVTTSAGSGLSRFTYHASLPVAWGDRDHDLTRYTLTLPRRVGSSAEGTFLDRYKESCADEPEKATRDNFWYHYRPNKSGCSLSAADIVTATATVTPSARNTTGMYPEYDRVWEDGILRIVAIFGKTEVDATTASDQGIGAYNSFVAAMTDLLSGATVSPPLAGPPGVATREVTFDLTRSNGTRVEATVILTDKLLDEGASFDKRYAELSAGADLILYNGHAGLGGNVRALAEKGHFLPGKYQLFFFNGCDTLAYIDDTLAERRAALNPDDPKGTRYMDVITNAMPGYFNQMARASTQIVKAMLAADHPATYDKILSGFHESQLVVVNGEEDNRFRPSASITPTWTMSKAGAVRKAETASYETDVLPAGSYVFSLLPLQSIRGGDADLRVRVGSAPAITSEFKCPSFVANSNEQCTLNLAAPAKVYIAVTGDTPAIASPYELRAYRK